MAENKETNQEVQETNTEAANTEVTESTETESVNDGVKVVNGVKMAPVPASIQEQVAKNERRTVKKLVEDTLKGKYGSGRERMMLLGDKYEEVQNEINQMVKKGEV